MKPIQRILVATDFSPCAAAAADVAARLAQQLNAMVDVVSVVDTSGWTEVSGNPALCRQRVREIRERVRERAGRVGEEHFAEVEDVRVHVRDGEDPVGEIIRAAGDLSSDLIVMGTHGTRGLAHVILGSIAEKVVRTSSVPVVTVRAPA